MSGVRPMVQVVPLRSHLSNGAGVKTWGWARPGSPAGGTHLNTVIRQYYALLSATPVDAKRAWRPDLHAWTGESLEVRQPRLSKGPSRRLLPGSPGYPGPPWVGPAACLYVVAVRGNVLI
jgi:hypothetical protein